MKKFSIHAIRMITVCLVGCCSAAYSQSTYKIVGTKDIDMKLMGTSTLHQWSMDTKTVEGEAQFIFDPDNEFHFVELKSLTFSLEVADLKSDNSGLDKNAYKALKSGKYKDIHYKLISSVVSNVPGEIGNDYLLVTQGHLSIAGVTKPITMNIHCRVNKDGTILCTGSEKLNMSDYNVTPPTFMLGAMKTGDAITLDFKVVYKKQKAI